METLVKAASDFLAAVLSTIGFVGRPRRRAGIHDDLRLLGELRQSPDFGSDSAAHRFLIGHITLEVAKFSGVELKHKKNVPWASLAMALFVGAPLGYWAYKLNEDGFQWLSVLPGTIAALMAIAALGLIFDRGEPPGERDASDIPGAGDAS